MIRMKLLGLGTAAALAAGTGLSPVAPADAASPGAATQAAQIAPNAAPTPSALPVRGALADGTAFTGQISNLSTQVVNGVLTMTGTITGTGLPAAGTTFTAPVQNITAPDACQVLTLNLGPLHLNLLGLVIDLAPVNLDITAQPGAGNLLGNLVCAVAGLLDNTGQSGGALNGISALLDRLLTGLGL
jgi:hypothetical protein